jgi:hypothetical protein
MKAKLVKILVISAVLAFFSAGVSLAHDWKGGRHNSPKAKAYSHYKQDNKNHHKFDRNRHFQNQYRHKHLSKHDRCHPRRPVVIHKHHHHHHHHYRPYWNCRSHAGIGFSLSVLDPNVAFLIGVMGR